MRRQRRSFSIVSLIMERRGLSSWSGLIVNVRSKAVQIRDRSVLCGGDRSREAAAGRLTNHPGQAPRGRAAIVLRIRGDRHRRR